MCSSSPRLDGKLVVTTTPTGGQVGMVFRVLPPEAFGLVPEPGRAPTQQEIDRVKAPYESKQVRLTRERNQARERAEREDV